MKRCKTHLVRVCVIVLAAVPAYCQRGTFGIDIGQTSDKFDALSSVSGLEVDVDGQITVLKSNRNRVAPASWPGARSACRPIPEIMPRSTPSLEDLVFQFRELSIGVERSGPQDRSSHARPSIQVFARDTMELLELPVVTQIQLRRSRSHKAWVDRPRCTGIHAAIPYGRVNPGLFTQSASRSRLLHPRKSRATRSASGTRRRRTRPATSSSGPPGQSQ